MYIERTVMKSGLIERCGQVSRDTTSLVREVEFPGGQKSCSRRCTNRVCSIQVGYKRNGPLSDFVIFKPFSGHRLGLVRFSDNFFTRLCNSDNYVLIGVLRFLDVSSEVMFSNCNIQIIYKAHILLMSSINSDMSIFV